MPLSFFRSHLMTLSLAALLAPTGLARAQSTAATNTARYVETQPGPNRFPLVAGSVSAPLLVSANDFPGVIRAARDLRADINRVTRIEPAFSTDSLPTARQLIIIGTLGKNAVIDRLVRERRIDAAGIAGKWEAHVTQVVDKPAPGVDRALVIAGSDKRGTIYGI